MHNNCTTCYSATPICASPSTTIPKYNQPLPTKHPKFCTTHCSPKVDAPSLSLWAVSQHSTLPANLHRTDLGTGGCLSMWFHTNKLISAATSRLSNLLQPVISSAFYNTLAPCFNPENADANTNNSGICKAWEGDFSLGLAFTHSSHLSDLPMACHLISNPSSLMLLLSEALLAIIATIYPTHIYIQNSGLVPSSTSLPLANNLPTILYPNSRCTSLVLHPPSYGWLEHSANLDLACAPSDCLDVALVPLLCRACQFILPADNLTDIEQVQQCIDPGGSNFKDPRRCKWGIACDLGLVHPGPCDAELTTDNSTYQHPCTPSPSHSLSSLLLAPLLPFLSIAVQVPACLTSSCCWCHKHLADATRACYLAICQASAMHVEFNILPPTLTWVHTLVG